MDVLDWAIGVDIAAQRRELERYNAAMGFNDEPQWPAERAQDRAADFWAREPEEPDYEDITDEFRGRLYHHPGGFDPFGPSFPHGKVL
ncbi:hypothetical protein CEP52_002964 [Fusarium oligoseptatum]|uniref:Uncharacterized protein n=1 Tax=Fusarium oligoseptatum TaxID=2604345 RepID=A0A428UAW8_9HYPO|nr:hypothetical protein CEP52_002964 [Fusarium oligoseptatum]